MRYRSLLAPDVSVTGPDGAPLTKKSGKSIHPNTSFDSGSGRSTPALIDSDTEADMSEIRRAQKLAMNISPIHSTPSAHRCIRQIVRGEYATFLKEAEMGLRRQRVYLVATDLSEEAAYALEWTIGTVLRDGDTLLAVYAVDEEAGTGGEAGSVGVGEGAKAMQEATKLVKTLSNEPAKGSSSMLSPLQNEIRVDEKPNFERMSKAERERWHAAEEVGDRCVKLLRKTRLQVRVIVEVFHCKSPKHMITEVVSRPSPLRLAHQDAASNLCTMADFVIRSTISNLHSLCWALEVGTQSKGKSSTIRSRYHCICMAQFFCPHNGSLTLVQCPPRVLQQLPRHQILRPRHGGAKASAQAQQVQARQHAHVERALDTELQACKCED